MSKEPPQSEVTRDINLQEVPEDLLVQEMERRMEEMSGGEREQVIQTITHQQEFSGPLPPPPILQDYERIQPGFANRIVSMAEVQQSHRHNLEKKSVDAAIGVEARGQHYALAVSILIILGSLFLIANGKEISGTILAGGTLTGLAYIFITGRNKKVEDDPN